MATFTVDDSTLWYSVTGAGPPLVFIHGGWLDSDMWRAQVEHYADSHRVLTYDIRGHGRTEATDRPRYSIDLFVDDLERLLDHLGIERPILCGLSLGSMIVQEYLDRYPDQVAKAILAGSIQDDPPFVPV